MKLELKRHNEDSAVICIFLILEYAVSITLLNCLQDDFFRRLNGKSLKIGLFKNFHLNLRKYSFDFKTVGNIASLHNIHATRSKPVSAENLQTRSTGCPPKKPKTIKSTIAKIWIPYHFLKQSL